MNTKSNSVTTKQNTELKTKPHENYNSLKPNTIKLSDKKKTLYVTDLDGTLLNNQRALSPFTIEHMNRFIEDGHLITYATARSLTSARMVAGELKVVLPIISNNGTFIVDPISEEKLAGNFFSPELVEQLTTIFQNLKANPLVYAFHTNEQKSLLELKERISWITGDESEGLKYYIDQRTTDPRMRPLAPSQAGDLCAGNIFYFTCIGSRTELLPVYEAVRNLEGINCIFHQELYRPEFWCEIMPQNATKANAMLQLKELLQCDEVICFGDGENDIPMFLAADQGFAMENAVPELKKLATGIIGHNNEDGVAKWLSKHLK